MSADTLDIVSPDILAIEEVAQQPQAQPVGGCIHPTMEVSPLFVTRKVLLRNLFFINDERSRYISVGFYTAKEYQPLIEICGAGIEPIIFGTIVAALLMQHIPNVVQAIHGRHRYMINALDGTLILPTSGRFSKARVTVANVGLTLKLAKWK